ncbi:hypothetical protein GCM10010191_38630 [Actinomadura vinacea]|uniref:Uncharacterized protein n=1 Tax=Actinomadura vinacea TaxID=115336 RepID=A0ABP5WDM7_9ACTN
MSQSPLLEHGRHRLPGDRACVMELVSVLNGEPWSDHPRCVHPVLAAVARTVNDLVGPSASERLAALAPEMIGTAQAGRDAGARLVARCAEQALRRPPRDGRLRYTLEWDLRTARRRLRNLGDLDPARRWTALLERLRDHDAALQVVVAIRAAAPRTTDDELLALLRDCITDVRQTRTQGDRSRILL